ncbi:DUF3093 domain-containing protein [Jatrophihabitans sp.]|uniref:DUF3093 domain-containing protein n=1 Tax=Jatrophihabitans sp. TaxID=1932789 RepID=UPI002B65A9E0|nr:DUF3093 domain-containing protein [Jatrophihabitans sp.]
MAPSTSQARPAEPAPGYVEQLRTPWWWYLGAVGVALLLSLEFAVAVPGWLAWAPFVVLLPGGLLFVRRLSAGRIVVAAGTVRAGARSVAVADIEQAIDLTPLELRRLVGRHGDPLAYTYIRSWIGPGVQLVLRPPAAPPPGSESDERYPEPYWVLSTRHPDRLLAALAAATAPSAG